MTARTLLWLGAHLGHRLPWALGLAVATALWARTLPGGDEGGITAWGLLGVVLSLAVGARAVSRDLEGGAVLLWIQKPGRPAAHYGARLATAALAAPALHLLVGGIMAATGALPLPAAGPLLALLLTDLGVVALAFLVSAGSVPLESGAAAALLVLLAGVGTDAFLAPETLGGWAPWLAAVRFPVLENRAVALWMAGVGSVPEAGTWGRSLLWPLATGGLSLALVELRLRPRGRPLRRGPAPGPGRAPLP